MGAEWTDADIMQVQDRLATLQHVVAIRVIPAIKENQRALTRLSFLASSLMAMSVASIILSAVTLWMVIDGK
jgi:hypothetical protein